MQLAHDELCAEIVFGRNLGRTHHDMTFFQDRTSDITDDTLLAETRAKLQMTPVWWVALFVQGFCALIQHPRRCPYLRVSFLG